MPVRYELVVFHRGVSRSLALPARGTVGVGRDPSQGIVIDDPSVSRCHATISVDGDEVIVEDEGSANRTVVVREIAGAKQPRTATERQTIVALEPTPIFEGDSVLMGAAVLVLRRLPAVDDTPMAALDRLVAQIAPNPIRVLLLGETGVGKEVLAERIHRASPRASERLSKVHCAGLSESLLESELFGHEKGAFTGALQARVGLFEAAHKGTLFLDEVGEMSPTAQVKLLRVLEDGKIQRVGSSDTIEIDVRILSATHRDLAHEVRAGRFRQDLYFRLNGITLRIPPLRERRAEIPSLARELLERAAVKAGRPTPALSDGALRRLERHAWPGNVRELRQVMERAVALANGAIVDEREIMLDGDGDEPLSELRPTLRDDLESIEKQRILDAIAACGGSQTRAAEVLGMPRRTLVERLRKWGFTRARPAREPR